MNQPLTEEFSAGQWRIVPNPVGSGALAGIACLSKLNECWAVGYSNGNALIQHDTGSGWVTVASPPVPGSQATFLNAVTCMSTTNCWAVGNYYTTSGALVTLTEHYDGSQWAVFPSTNPVGSGTVQLFDVSCSSATECWAVGSFSQNGRGRTLIEHSTGAGWIKVTSPNASSRENMLGGVKCVGSGRCWAVGSYEAPRGSLTFLKTLIEHHVP